MLRRGDVTLYERDIAYQQSPDGIDGSTGAQTQGGLSGQRAEQIAIVLDTGPMPATLEPLGEG